MNIHTEIKEHHFKQVEQQFVILCIGKEVQYLVHNNNTYLTSEKYFWITKVWYRFKINNCRFWWYIHYIEWEIGCYLLDKSRKSKIHRIGADMKGKGQDTQGGHLASCRALDRPDMLGALWHNRDRLLHWRGRYLHDDPMAAEEDVRWGEGARGGSRHVARCCVGVRNEDAGQGALRE